MSVAKIADEKAANISSLVWNYWLSDAVGSNPPQGANYLPRIDEGMLSLEKLRRLNFRLSAYDLSRLRAVKRANLSVPLAEVIEGAISDADKEFLELTAIVTSVDGARLYIPEKSRESKLRIDLTHLRAVLSAPHQAEDEQKTVADILKTAAVAEFGFDFKLRRQGKHEVAITLLDTETGFPVQAMIASIEDGLHWPHNISLLASEGSFLEPAGDAVELSLRLYQLSTTDSEGFAPKLHAQLWYKDAKGVSSYIPWSTSVTAKALTGYASTYRSLAGDAASDQPILDLGAEVGIAIFSSPMNSDESYQNSIKARDIIIHNAAQAETALPPTLTVHFFSSTAESLEKYSSVVFPFQIIGVPNPSTGKPEFLGERFAVALRLSGLPPPANAPCPGDWRFVLPKMSALGDKAISQALGALGKEISSRFASSLYEQDSDLSELTSWLAKNESTEVAWVYLGHHKERRLYLNESGKSVTVGSIKQKFVGRSIAILNACDTAMEDINTGMPIGKLFENHISAVIATTSPVPGVLAGDYLVCLSAVLRHYTDLTIGEAQTLTTRCLWSAEGRKKWGLEAIGGYGGKALNYLLIGNPLQRVCAPKEIQ